MGTEDHLPRRQEDRVLRTLRLLKNKTQQKQIIIKFSFQKTISKSIYQRTILKLKFLKTTSKLKPQILESFLCNSRWRPRLCWAWLSQRSSCKELDIQNTRAWKWMVQLLRQICTLDV